MVVLMHRNELICMKIEIAMLVCILLMVITSLSGSCALPPSEEWNKTVDSGRLATGNSMQETNDGGYIILSWPINLIKTNSFGEKLWKSTIDGPGNDEGVSIQETSDTGYIIVGKTDSYGSGNYDIWLIKTDSSGREQWNKTFGRSGLDEGYSVKETQDGGYIVAGKRLVSTKQGFDIWLIKMDRYGKEQWNKLIGLDFVWEEPYSIQETRDGGYIIAGSALSQKTNCMDILLVKTDSSGTVEWMNAYRGVGWDAGKSVKETTDGGYIIVGDRYSRLLKTDQYGTEQWNKTFGDCPEDRCNSVQETKDGGYIIGGWNSCPLKDGGTYCKSKGYWLIKADKFGNEQWNKTFYSNGGSTFAQETKDGGYIIVGHQYQHGTEVIQLIKMSSAKER